jgi:hypothetical protein
VRHVDEGFDEAGQAAGVRCAPGALLTREAPAGTARKRAIAAKGCDRPRKDRETPLEMAQKGDFEITRRSAQGKR